MNGTQTDPALLRFRDLFHAREELWNILCELEGILDPIKGDAAAVAAISELVATYNSDIASAEGLKHCAGRLKDRLEDVEEWSNRLAAAIKVARANDSNLLSETEVMHRLNPHLPLTPPAGEWA